MSEAFHYGCFQAQVRQVCPEALAKSRLIAVMWPWSANLCATWQTTAVSASLIVGVSLLFSVSKTLHRAQIE